MPETKRQLYSHHIFIFPFKWLSKNNRKGTFSEQTSLNLLDNFFPSGDDWVREPYKIDKPANYNEYNYFYDYVREALYDTHNSPLHDSESGAERLLRHFRYNLEATEGHNFIINIEQKDKAGKDLPDKIYLLEVDSILLQFYDTGVGILSFHLLNRLENQSAPEDILAINQFGRRLYPPFFQLPKELVGDQALFDYDEKWALPASSELGKSISLEIKGKQSFLENWKDYQKPDKFQENPFLLPKFISGILPTAFVEAYNLVPVLDDRMFVVCWYGNDELAKAMYRPAKIEKGRLGTRRNLPASAHYLSDEWWYKFVFVDAKGLTCQNEAMQAELVKQATNSRWANYGTFYGATDYSFVMLTSTMAHLKKPYINAAFLVTHLQTIYYKIAELVLLQRASVQRFSEEITHISRLEVTDDHTLVSQKIGSLYRQYIRFVNKVFFRAATAQVQGVELYHLLQQQSRIEKEVKDLHGEIHELHNYALQMLEQERVKQEQLQTASDEERNQRLELLTILGVVFLPPSLLLALFGVSILGEVNESCEVKALWWLAGLIVCSGVFSWLAYKKRNINWLWALGIVMLLGITSPVFIAQCHSCKPGNPPEAIQLRHIREQLQSIQQQFYKFSLPLPVVVDTTKNHKK